MPSTEPLRGVGVIDGEGPEDTWVRYELSWSTMGDTLTVTHWAGWVAPLCTRASLPTGVTRSLALLEHDVHLKLSIFPGRQRGQLRFYPVSARVASNTSV